MKPGIVAFFLALVIVIADLTSYRTLKLLPSLSGAAWLPWVHFGITGLFLAGIIVVGLSFGKMDNPATFRNILWFLGFFMMFYFPKLILGFSTLVEWIFSSITGLLSPENKMHFLWILRTGVILALTLFLLFAEGIFIGRTHLKTNTVHLPPGRLPESFMGMKVVQISDLHLGGFYGNAAYLEKVVKRINALEPDLILFTGDLVNNFAKEAEPFTALLSQLNAKEGKFAVLGNHDYGKYYRWPTPEAEAQNLSDVKQAVRDAGFRLLLNENVSITRGDDTITLAGVENWGKPPFPQYGDLEIALNGEDFFSYTILMSHDPSHWEAEVLPLSETDLTLSGHTHAMQMGIELGKFRWSPSGWMYRQWGGLYEKEGRFLYVNRGLGFTGFPGRIGERPEITLLVLGDN